MYLAFDHGNLLLQVLKIGIRGSGHVRLASVFVPAEIVFLALRQW
jgi:hypothetical protein